MRAARKLSLIRCSAPTLTLSREYTGEGIRNRFFTAIALIALLLFAVPAFAQTRPNTGVETQAIQRSQPTTNLTANDGVNWQRLVTAMFVVLLLIIALRYAAGWLMPGMRSGGGGRGVRVLGRTAIAPRQQVLLIHVGRRVLVVGDSGGRLSSLASIEEPDEVAELLGQVSQTPPATATTKFKALFGRATTDYVPPERIEAESFTAADDPEAPVPEDANVAAAQNEISGLLDRMRSLAKNVKEQK